MQTDRNGGRKPPRDLSFNCNVRCEPRDTSLFKNVICLKPRPRPRLLRAPPLPHGRALAPVPAIDAPWPHPSVFYPEASGSFPPGLQPSSCFDFLPTRCRRHCSSASVSTGRRPGPRGPRWAPTAFPRPQGGSPRLRDPRRGHPLPRLHIPAAWCGRPRCGLRPSPSAPLGPGRSAIFLCSSRSLLSLGASTPDSLSADDLRPREGTPSRP